jgi:hypothetical protein
MSRTRRLAAALAASSLLGCAALGWVLAQVWPRTLRTHRDAVALTLERHGVRFAAIDFAQSYEESVNLRSFSAGVRIRLDDGAVAHGWIGCEQGQRQCFLELRSVGIRGERLPDLTDNTNAWDWQGWRDRVRRWLGGGIWGNLVSPSAPI